MALSAVRNEYGLGEPELYREANREDPKAVVDEVAVAGLVGILRQLGDLSEFVAEVFHGLQEQVMSTSSRSHKIQCIEAALAPLEKILVSKSFVSLFLKTVDISIYFRFNHTCSLKGDHLKGCFAGYNRHSYLQNEQNHFIYSDLPNCIMDSYEECSDPPRLQLLDKFDTGGPGSCLKRYSDPTFFRRASANSREANVEKVSKDRKACRSKTKRTWQRNEVSHGASTTVAELNLVL
ncbi:Protein SCAR3 [Camellia lanceoleosa]|uniref:Protein SCAR3 n=1 Tax=Camellia lanceoleosa TaxID=1840588 RepID=A0ACC0GG50_9ERIC|nr:Protein SCAR3 [Camellia lanceoleosa]